MNHPLRESYTDRITHVSISGKYITETSIINIIFNEEINQLITMYCRCYEASRIGISINNLHDNIPNINHEHTPPRTRFAEL